MTENKIQMESTSENNKIYDSLVIGGGIAGQEAALSLADMGYQVLLVDKALSIGGKMIQLQGVPHSGLCSVYYYT